MRKALMGLALLAVLLGLAAMLAQRYGTRFGFEFTPTPDLMVRWSSGCTTATRTTVIPFMFSRVKTMPRRCPSKPWACPRVKSP